MFLSLSNVAEQILCKHKRKYIGITIVFTARYMLFRCIVKPPQSIAPGTSSENIPFGLARPWNATMADVVTKQIMPIAFSADHGLYIRGMCNIVNESYTMSSHHGGLV